MCILDAAHAHGWLWPISFSISRGHLDAGIEAPIQAENKTRLSMSALSMIQLHEQIMPACSQTTGHNGMSGHGGPGYRAGLVDDMPHDIGVSAAIVAKYSMENSAI